MHILFLIDSSTKNPFTKTHLATIKACNPDVSIQITDKPTQQQLATTEILIPHVPLNVLDRYTFPNLKWIHVTSAGVNGLPDEVIHSNIIVTNSSGVHPIPISEQIFSYLLMFARNMHLTTRNQEKKLWDKEMLHPFELYGKTIAIIGLGRIGGNVAKLAKAFNMRVLAVKTTVTKEKYVDGVFVLKDLRKVLGQADFIVNCLPGTEETMQLFTLKEFKLMKRSSYFINIGRGFSVKEEDLIIALSTHIIAGAGLDVFETEPLPKTSKLWGLDNVIITPHSAGKTPEYFNRVVAIFCENLKAFLENTTLPNAVDKQRGY